MDKAFGESMRREQMEQRDNVILDIIPEEKGFKMVRPGQGFRSKKLKQKVSSGDLLYLSILTRQFLTEVKLQTLQIQNIQFLPTGQFVCRSRRSTQD